jgi:hypothetical protein
MDIRLIIKDGERRYTMPVKDVHEVIWTDDALGAEEERDLKVDAGTIKCRRRGLDVLTIASDFVVTVYRDDPPPSAAKPRCRRSAKPTEQPDEPPEAPAG